MSDRIDLVLVGGGLANGLIAWRLKQQRPELHVVLVESSDRLGGNHTWSFHTGDLLAEQHEWIKPLVTSSWPSHQVRFPEYCREFASGYHSITSERFHEVVSRELGEDACVGCEAQSVEAQKVILKDGRYLQAGAVIDGRGARGGSKVQIAFQKFLGLVVELKHNHGLKSPILMDATVEQRGGFRFFYSLPFDKRTLLVEDTRYSDGPQLDRDELRAEIHSYCKQQGWKIRGVVREEEGALPIVLSGSIETLMNESRGVPASGLRAGLFHHTTGYSLPEAVRMADDLATRSELSADALAECLPARSRRHWKRQRFFRVLNRMLFRAAEPEQRYRVLEHFYRLPEPLVERFYAGRLTWSDRIRILSGKPPVPVVRALRSVFAS